MSNYWVLPNGINTLSGVFEDPDNQPQLPDELILEFLSDGNQKARDDFQALLPTMTELEQERLNLLWAYSRKPDKYQSVLEDDFQTSMNTLRVNNPSMRRLPSQATNNSSNARSALVVRIK